MRASYQQEHSGTNASFPYRAVAPGTVAWSLCAAFAAGWACPLLLAQDPVPPPSGSAPATQATTVAKQEEITTLEVGKPIDRELGGGQRHKYQIVVCEGQYMKVEIREKGIGVGVSVQRADEDVFQAWLPFQARQDLKPIQYVAQTSAILRFDVYATTKAPPGRYEVRLAELRPATDKDRSVDAANKLFRQYARLRDQGRWFEGRPLLVRALEIREKVLGQDDLVVADTLSFLANNYEYTGDYASAEPLMLRALKIKQKVLGPDHQEVAEELFQIGSSYRHRGDYVKAEQTQQTSLSILEKTGLGQTPMAAADLESLGRIYYARGDYANAEIYYQRGHAVWEKILGPDHYHIAPSLTFLGQVAYDTGDYGKANAMFQRALTLSEKYLGQDHLDVTPYVNSLAMVYCTTGEYAKGEALYLRALSVHEQKAAMSMPPVQNTLYGLARCFAAQGNASEAVRLQAQASEIEERFVAVNLAAGSEREKQALHDSLYSHSLRNISLHAQLAPRDPAALHLAFTTILRQKGRVQDAMSNGLSGLRQQLGAESQKLLGQLNDVTSKLAKLALTPPPQLPAAEHQEQIKLLENRREDLEAEISRHSAGLYAGSKPATLDKIQAAIPADAALIELGVYRPFDPRAPDNQKAFGEPRYVAYIVRNQGEVRWSDLGSASVIDQAINSLREALRDPQRNDVRQLARTVDSLVMQPVLSLTGAVAHLIISPDGELNLLPFEALVDGEGQYLVERYLITYLTTGRDLLRMGVARTSNGRPLVLADPLFGEPKITHGVKAHPSAMRPAAVVARRGITTGNDLSNVYFAPLAGTAEEIHMIQGLFPQAQIFTGARATKSVLQRVAAPWLLHIATHGFFLQDATTGKAQDVGGGETSGNHLLLAGSRTANPLLRSGLALAGANLNKSGNEDGILSALETSSLDLWGTKLVTLSACDTGVGEVKNGEGVYGLRRSFFLAGAETLVMSLWPVSDYVTRELMTAYYTGLKNGLGRGQALRQAQLSVMKRKGREHPFYWASFIQSGEWANLDGQR
jgi:CHAT domain-containing protein/tetratricopeptide (TPR) repeat protein